jgi:hypothetical protein
MEKETITIEATDSSGTVVDSMKINFRINEIINISAGN